MEVYGKTFTGLGPNISVCSNRQMLMLLILNVCSILIVAKMNLATLAFRELINDRHLVEHTCCDF